MADDDRLADIASSLAGYEATALPVDVARRFIGRLVHRVHGSERIPLRQALGRVLAEDMLAGIDVPPHDNAAMDGYALRFADLSTDGATTLAVVGRSLAGDAHRGAVDARECVRITTGATLPAGLDTVVPQEWVSADGADHIVVPARAVGAGDHRRRAGEDLACGTVALHAGRLLKPADLGLLASLGHADVDVRRRVRVAMFTTGDELRSAGDAPAAGAVFDSNRYTLLGMLDRIGVDVIDLGVVRDEPQALCAAFRAAAAQADAVITSGGVSGGEADHTRAAMAAVGDVLFWGLAMRPGRPMAIGRIPAPGATASAPSLPRPPSAALLFGLPGNPVAVMVTFYALVRDALLAMAGATTLPRLMLRATVTAAIAKKPGRTEYVRGIATPDAAGALHVRPSGSQGSGVLRSMSESNVLIVLPHGQGDVALGDGVDVWPFDGFT